MRCQWTCILRAVQLDSRYITVTAACVIQAVMVGAMLRFHDRVAQMIMCNMLLGVTWIWPMLLLLPVAAAAACASCCKRQPRKAKRE